MLTHIIAKTLVINDAGKILLLVRSADDAHRPGGFDLPGGKVDDGEEYAVGAAREAIEEVGLRLDPAGFRLSYAAVKVAAVDGAASDTNMVWLGYAVKVTAGAIVRLGNEHSAYEWVTLSEAAAKTDSDNQRTFFEHVLNNNILANLWDPTD